MSLKTKFFIDRFPGISNAGCFSVGKCNCVDGVGVLVVEDKDVVIATAGGDRELAGLIRIGLQDFLVWKKHAAKMMGFGSVGSNHVVDFRGRSYVIIGRGALELFCGA